MLFHQQCGPRENCPSFKSQEVNLDPMTISCWENQSVSAKKICFHSTYITQKIRRLVPERLYIRTEITSWHPKNSKHLRSHSRTIMALDHSRLGLENKFLENKSGRIFLRSIGSLYKFLPTNLGVCKPTFCTLYTSHLRWNSTICHTDLGQDAAFHNFSRQIALSQYSGRLIVGF